MAPYCATPRDYLSDTPLFARYGVFGASTWPIGCGTPSPFSERFPLGEHAKWGRDTPHKRGISAILARYPMKKGKKGAIPPLCDTISKGYCTIWGGISHWAVKPNTDSKLALSKILTGRLPLRRVEAVAEIKASKIVTDAF